MHKAYMNWSSGKDSALAYYYLSKDPTISIKKLVTTINSSENEVSMHGLPEKLLDAQAKSMNLDLKKIYLPFKTGKKDYDEIMQKNVGELKAENFTHAVFGDIFLEDLKRYREEELKSEAIKTVFPIWKKDTSKLIYDFINLGFKAICLCVNLKVLDKSFCGREIDKNFIKDLPPNCDPCGENGEFHTFVYDAPFFRNRIEFKKGEIYIKKYPSSNNTWDSEFAYLKLNNNTN